MRRSIIPALKVLAFIAALPLSAASYKQAEFTRLENEVKVLKENVAPKAAAVGEQINPVTSVATGANSRAELRFPDKSLTRLGANSRFTLRGEARTLDLNSGVMMLQVPDQITGAKVRTAAVTAAVTGGTVIFEFLPDGYIKVVVVEGSVDLSMNKDPSNFITISAGQMIIMKPDSTSFPRPVDVDLKRLLQTSKLLTADDRNAPNTNLIHDAVQQQQGEIKNGDLVKTHLVIPGRGTQVNLASDIRLNLFNNFKLKDKPAPLQGNGPPPGGPNKPGQPNTFNGQPLTAKVDQIKGQTVLNSYSTIVTNPHVTAYNTSTHSVQTNTGKLYNGLNDGTFPGFTFGSAGIVGPDFQVSLNDKGTWAVFRFESLLINGSPSIYVPYPGDTVLPFTPTDFGISNLALASDGDIVLGNIAFPTEGKEAQPTESLLGVHLTDLRSLLLYSQNGNVSLNNDFSIRASNQDVSIVAAGQAADVTLRGGIDLNYPTYSVLSTDTVMTTPIVTDGSNTQLAITAGHDINITGTYALLNADNISLDAGNDILIDDQAVITAKKNIKLVAQGGITISNSSQLKALSNLPPDGLMVMQAGKNISITGDGEVNTLEAREIQIESLGGNITFTDLITSGDIFKARTLANNGVLEFKGDVGSITANTLIRLYAEGLNGKVLFSGNTILSSQNIDIAGNTVEIAAGKKVTVPSSAALNVFSNNHNYNDSIHGEFSNGVYQKAATQGAFNARPAFK